MHILYGVVGEGMGHAMRSAVILEALKDQGHEFRIVVSGRAANYLEQRFPGQTVSITGMTMAYEDNVVRKMKTALQNFKALKGLPKNFKKYVEMARDFSPDLVISDFESWTYWFARGQKLPVISIDNMQIIPRCRHEEQIIAGSRKDFQLAKQIVKAKLPSCNAYLVTSFFYPPLKKERTSLHPPILRPQVLAAKERVSVKDHVLVYQTAEGNQALLEQLRAIDVPFKLYGARRNLTEVEREGNLEFCPFSEDQFITDLAESRAVVASAGFTLMGEAVYLGKPMLAVPLEGQFEQVLNANYLAQLGYGERAEEVSRQILEDFLSRTDAYRESLAQFEHDNNDGLIRRLTAEMNKAIEEGPRGL